MMSRLGLSCSEMTSSTVTMLVCYGAIQSSMRLAIDTTHLREAGAAQGAADVLQHVRLVALHYVQRRHAVHVHLGTRYRPVELTGETVTTLRGDGELTYELVSLSTQYERSCDTFSTFYGG